MTNGYYVYMLIDPRNLLPFYVGLGCGRRANYHLKEKSVYKTENVRKFICIRDLRLAGVEPKIVVVRDNLDQSTAAKMEKTYILLLGRSLIDDFGILTNRSVYNKNVGSTLINKMDSQEYNSFISGQLTPSYVSKHYGVSLKTAYMHLPPRQKRLSPLEKHQIRRATSKPGTLARKFGVSVDTIRKVRGSSSYAVITKEMKEQLSSGHMSPRELSRETGIRVSSLARHSPFGERAWIVTESDRKIVHLNPSQSIYRLSKVLNLSWDIVSSIRKGRYDSIRLPTRRER